MKYKYWIILLYIGYTLKTKHKNLTIFFSSLFVIENLQNRLIFEYFKFSFVVKFRQKNTHEIMYLKKKVVLQKGRPNFQMDQKIESKWSTKDLVCNKLNWCIVQIEGCVVS